MSWQIFVTDAAAVDFSRLSEDERLAVNENLFAWVDRGPPKSNRREIEGATIFEDVLQSGFGVAYFTSEAEPYVAILRIRRTA